MATKKNTAIVESFEEVNDDEMAIAPIIDFDMVTAGNGKFINTVNMSTFDGKVNVVNALNDAISLKTAKDTVLDICDCITMPGVRKGRGGMPDTECQNTYLIDTEGNAWFTQSDGIARSVKMLAMMFPDFGKNTKDKCLHVKVQERELDNGNTIKSLVIDN